LLPINRLSINDVTDVADFQRYIIKAAVEIAKNLENKSCLQPGGLRYAWPVGSNFKAFLFVLVGLLPSVGRADGTNGQIFRVATFNVENYLDGRSGTRPAKSPEGRAKVRESILALHPDVLALEEMGSTNALLQLQADLKAGGLDLPFWDEVNGFDTNIHVAVLSRFSILARRPHTNENFLLDGRRFQVSRGFAEMDIQVSPKCKFTLIAAHLKSKRPSPLADEEEWRYQEALALRRIIDARLENDPAENLIVLGDFNDLKDSKPIRAIMGRGRARLFDTHPAERNGDTIGSPVNWTHFYAKEDSYTRIDYILLSHAMEERWVAAETYVLASPNWGVASDHRPVVAGFRIGD
jgi:endonuclease/exonuclease/phosphatase family metal-dependent hydrolase